VFPPPFAPPPGAPAPDLSVVVPTLNEAENVGPLAAEIARALAGRVTYEILFVDDGSTDGTADAVRRLAASAPADGRVRLLRHSRRCGQSAGVRTGVAAARAPLVATLDGDGQNDPADLPRLLEIWRATPHDQPLLLAGERRRRQDPLAKRLSSRIANGVRRRLLGDRLNDTGCGLKLFERQLFLDLPYFAHMHRYLGALVLRQGGRVEPVPVNHRPRARGASKYGLFDRLWVGVVDMLGVMWLQSRAGVPPKVEEG
jgi:dolichol-phosphate mannosyltransferase